jgi:hypothetical protein
MLVGSAEIMRFEICDEKRIFEKNTYFLVKIILNAIH